MPDVLSAARQSGQPIDRCFGCQKCTAGCPTALEMDLAPHELVQAVLLGEGESVLSSSAIWLCVGCETCGQRCPNGISVGQLTNALRHLAVASGVPAREERVAAFHAASVDSVRHRGRIHEAALLLDYGRRAFLGPQALAALRGLATGQGGMRDDARVALQLVLRRKLPLRAVGGGPRRSMEAIFERCRGDRAEP